MKKILLLLLFCFTLLFSEEPKLVINKFDGESRIISINELESLSFTNSEKNSTFNIFLKNVNDDIFYFTELINIIRIDDDYLHISYTGSEINYELQLIDSITITPIPFEAVIIDNQMWMKRNLNVTHYRNGEEIFESDTYEEWEEAGISNSGVCSVYENNPENAELYGRLYNWFAVNDERGLPPKGWRVSSEEDWNVLKEVVGSNPGSKLAGGYDLWNHGYLRNNPAFDSTGFEALPGGNCNSKGRFNNLGSRANFWSSTSFDSANAILSQFAHEGSWILMSDDNKMSGKSVRCLRDILLQPVLKTPAKGSLQGTESIYFEWNKIHGANSYQIQISKYPEFEVLLSEIVNIKGEYYEMSLPEHNSKYFWRIKAVNDVFQSRWSEVSNFSTDGISKYDTVTIGNQIWMAKNLDVSHYRNGDTIFHAGTLKEWNAAIDSGYGAWCYYQNDPVIGDTYGKLYNRFAVNDPRGLAPEGWRIPDDDDWKTLELFLGVPEEDLDGIGERGSGAGTKLAGNYNLWADGALRNDSLFNESGFMAIPSGYRSNINARFEHFRQTAYFWTSSLETDLPAIYRYVSNDYTGIFRNIYGYNGYGFSVRCIKD